VVDNSESSRNGDYTPTRYDAQSDAVNIIFQKVVQGNPESSVGLMSMGGKGPEVLATLTTDQGKILEGLHQTKKKIRGSAHVSTGIQIASVRGTQGSSFAGTPANRLLPDSLRSSTARTSPNGHASSSLFAHPLKRENASWSFSPRR